MRGVLHEKASSDSSTNTRSSARDRAQHVRARTELGYKRRVAALTKVCNLTYKNLHTLSLSAQNIESENTYTFYLYIHSLDIHIISSLLT